MLQKRINDFLLKEQEDRKNRQRSGKFSPSSFGKCYRAQILNRANIEPSNPPDAIILRKMKAGQLFHNFVQQFIPDKQIEVEIDDEDVRGFADIISKDCVYDIKSQHSRAFWWQRKSNYDIKKEKYNNWLQVAYYAMKLNKKKIYLMFISKDDLCITEYFQYTVNWVKEVNKELKALRKYWNKYKNNNQLPPAKPRCFNGKECGYCNWQDWCNKYEQNNKSKK